MKHSTWVPDDRGAGPPVVIKDRIAELEDRLAAAVALLRETIDEDCGLRVAERIRAFLAEQERGK